MRIEKIGSTEIEERSNIRVHLTPIQSMGEYRDITDSLLSEDAANTQSPIIDVDIVDHNAAKINRKRAVFLNTEWNSEK
jgi:hypothetical protein